jgi:hypothetical protein
MPSSRVAFSIPQALALNLAFLFQIPVIAVMATGGGIRAMTSLYGQLAGLQELGLLDCISYITGASGSTWWVGCGQSAGGCRWLVGSGKGM